MIAAIACVDENYGIGYNNELLVRIPEDMKHFRQMTTENCVVMGRKTFESLGSKPLPNRTNFVISSKYEDVEFDVTDDSITYFIDLHTMRQYLKTANKYVFVKDYYIIGGGEIYRQLLPYCDIIYLTKVKHSYENVDTYFPNIDEESSGWEMMYSSETYSYDGIEYQFCTYRKGSTTVSDKELREMSIENNIEKKIAEDNVNHPSHYTHGGMECIDEMELIFGTEAVMHFCECNVWKYRKRASFKNGEEDMKKSDWYMAKYKELSEKPEDQRHHPLK